MKFIYCLFNVILFGVDEYSKLEGRWLVGSKLAKHHPSLLKAKRHCSKEGNCFGVMVIGTGKNGMYSMPFPKHDDTFWNIPFLSHIIPLCSVLPSWNSQKQRTSAY